jgi:16S rRNA processing protein RimM
VAHEAPVPGREGRLVVGLVRGLHALRGAVRVEVLSDDPSRYDPGSVLYPEGEDRPLTVVWSQADGPGVLLRFREIATRTHAEELRDRYLEADPQTGSLPDGAYLWHEVLGASVSLDDGEELGTVRDVFRAGGGEVLVVDGGARGELLVPAVRDVVREFAPREGRITVDREALGLDEEPPRPRPRGRRTTRAARSQPGPAAEPPAPGSAAERPAPEQPAPKAG